MKKGIVLVGINGVGKSTIGKHLANKLNLKLMEVEDYWFYDRYDYSNARGPEEVATLMLEDIQASQSGFVITGNIDNLGIEIAATIRLAVFVDTPLEVRMKRIAERELDYFGELSPEDKLYKERKSFRDFAYKRTTVKIEQWVQNFGKSIRIDGTLPIEENVEIISNAYLNE